MRTHCLPYERGVWRLQLEPLLPPHPLAGASFPPSVLRLL